MSRLSTDGLRQLAGQNTLRIHGNAGAGALTEEPCEPGDRETFGAKQAGKDVAGPDTGELIRVANQQEVCARCQCLHQLIGEEHIEHTCLVDDDQIGVERVFWAPPGLTAGAQLQDAVQCPCWMPSGLCHAFGRPAGGCCQHAA